MVGYYKNETLNAKEKLLAGCAAGVITRFITQPLDIIKLRTQIRRTKKPKNMFRTAKRIFFEEGPRAFWDGHLLGQVHSVAAVSSQFYVYELATMYMDRVEWTHNYRAYTRFVCGVFAGCCSATLVIPLEVIRVRQMLVKDQYRSLLTGAQAVYRYGGVFAFYEGLSASLLQMGPQVGISFVVFSYTQSFLLRFLSPPCKGTDDCSHGHGKPTMGNVTVASACAGSLAGLVSKTLTYPMDLAKRRLQLSTHKISEKYLVPSTLKRIIQCHNLMDCIRITLRKDGPRGLFRGWGITAYKAQVTSILAFTSYELICYCLRGFHPKKINDDTKITDKED